MESLLIYLIAFYLFLFCFNWVMAFVASLLNESFNNDNYLTTSGLSDFGKKPINFFHNKEL